MEEKFLLTDEEINEALLRSPYSLPSSPGEQGLDASMIKKYFYDFIVCLSKSINAHLAEVGTELGAQADADEGIKELLSGHNTSELAHQSLVNSLKSLISAISSQLTSHIEDSSSHKSIIDAAVLTHNTQESAHGDIRELISESKAIAESALSLASGKSKVIPVETAEEMLEYLLDNTPMAGDVFILEEKNTPDFTYFGTVDRSLLSSELQKGAIELTFEDYASGSVTLEAGCVYIFRGKKLVASESGFDASLLARKEAVNALEAQLNYQYNEIGRVFEAIERDMWSKEDKLVLQESAEDTVLIENGNEYSLGLKTSLTLTLPETVKTGFFAIVGFRTGQELGEFIMPQGAVIAGDDCEAGIFVPQQNRLYELSLKDVLGVVVIRIGAADYEVI